MALLCLCKYDFTDNVFIDTVNHYSLFGQKYEGHIYD